ncbi:MAG: carbonic anhydrase [Oscillospiraceae bacterium]
MILSQPRGFKSYHFSIILNRAKSFDKTGALGYTDCGIFLSKRRLVLIAYTPNREILEYNCAFVADKKYVPFLAQKSPRRKLAILTCMDTRLTVLLPKALGLRNGDAKIIKVAGASVTSLTDQAVKSLLVAVYQLGAAEIMVVGHTDCGALSLSRESLYDAMRKRGVPEDALDFMDHHTDTRAWFSGFSGVEEAVADSVRLLRRHPLITAEIAVGGYVIDSNTGALTYLEIT